MTELVRCRTPHGSETVGRVVDRRLEASVTGLNEVLTVDVEGTRFSVDAADAIPA